MSSSYPPAGERQKPHGEGVFTAENGVDGGWVVEEGGGGDILILDFDL